MSFDIGDLLGDDVGDDIEGEMDGDMDGDSLVGDSLVGDLEGDMLGDSLVGDSLVGDLLGDSEIGLSLNPLRLLRRKRAKRRAAAIMRKKVQNATVMRTLRATTKRNWFLPFTQLAVPAATTVNVNAQPQVTFRGRRLIVPSTIAPNFVLNAITIGVATNQAQFGAVSCMAFTENAIGTNLGLDTAQIGQLITMNVTNIDAAAHDFRASLTGVAVIQRAC